MSEPLVPKQPEADRRDYAYAIVKGAVSAIPIIGGVGEEVLSLILVSPLMKRQQEWFDSLAEALLTLQEKVDGFDLERLSEDEEFVTVALQATQSALRNHQQEKLEALRNAVLSAALPEPPTADLQLVFINLVDTLTAWHLRILKLFDDPRKWAAENNKPFPNWRTGAGHHVLYHAYPELKEYGDLDEKLVNDLASFGLAVLR